jgi:hypothetical protein
MAMKVSKVKRKPGLNYEERKQAEESMKNSFGSEQKPEDKKAKKEEPSAFQGLIDRLLGKPIKKEDNPGVGGSFTETMDARGRENLKKMKKKKNQ